MSGPETDNETVASAKPSIPDDKTEKSFFTMKTQEEVKTVLPDPRVQESSLRAAVSDPKPDEPAKTIEVAVPEKKKKDSMMVIDLESVKK